MYKPSAYLPNDKYLVGSFTACFPQASDLGDDRGRGGDGRASPAVALQDGANVQELAARVASGDERARWWAVAVEAWPAYAEYQTKTDREIPVVVLDPAK